MLCSWLIIDLGWHENALAAAWCPHRHEPWDLPSELEAETHGKADYPADIAACNGECHEENHLFT